MKYAAILLALFGAFSLAGCATIATGTNQTVKVKAVDTTTQEVIPEAKCRLKGGDGGTYVLDGNPSATAVNIKEGHLIAQCSKDGYSKGSEGVNQRFNAWTIADLIFWPSLFVDLASGAYERYPSEVDVEMTRVV